MPAVFEWLQQNGNVEQTEMYRTFNCGVGMVIVAAEDDAAAILQMLEDSGATAWQLGRIDSSSGDPAVIFE
jgi:phosphoribosylformylglycinamidine cyclo-ligase